MSVRGCYHGDPAGLSPSGLAFCAHCLAWLRGDPDPFPARPALDCTKAMIPQPAHRWAEDGSCRNERCEIRLDS